MSAAAGRPSAPDRALVAALAKGDRVGAADLFDAEFTWIDAHGREAREIGTPLLGDEAGLTPIVHRYEEAASVVAERGKLSCCASGSSGRPAGAASSITRCRRSCRRRRTGPAAATTTIRRAAFPIRRATRTEREALASWQRLEQAVIEHDAETWASHVADEFLVLGPTRRHGKADRKAVLEEQKRKDTPSAPSPLVWAQLHGVKDALVMRCQHQPFHGKAAQVSRLFIKRDGRWLMAVSFQTTEQDAPVKSID